MAEGIGEFLGNTVGEAAAFAAGLAVGPLLKPILQALENETWSLYPDRPLDASDAAELVAQAIWDSGTGTSEAALTGVSKTLFRALVQGAMVAPDTGEALELWRRGKITEAQVDVALDKAKILPDYRDAIKELFSHRLDPAVIAVAIQRGIMPDPGFLPVGPPTEDGKVPRFPVSSLDALAEAQASGIDQDRLFVETAIVGNPASPDLAARMTFRGIIDETDYARAISEGNTRNEWAPFLFDGFREILTAHDYVELRLRGWIDDAAMYAGTALHGMSQADTDLMFKVLGRPLSWHQVFIGLRRGGTYDGDVSDVDPAFLTALKQSNIRPEWYNLAWAQRFTYPAAFVLKALTTAGDIDQAEAEQILLYEGWEPTLAAKVSTAWAGGTTSTASTPTKTATTSAVRAVGKAYIAGNITQQTAEQELTTLGEDAASFPGLFTAWDVSRKATLQGLTNTQVRNRYRNLGLTETDAVQLLEDRGLSATDATAYLTA